MAELRMIDGKAVLVGVCAECQRPFYPKRIDAVTCNDRCRMARSRRERRIAKLRGKTPISYAHLRMVPILKPGRKGGKTATAATPPKQKKPTASK